MFAASRTFTNELGNKITIELIPEEGIFNTIKIIGPNSTSENTLTREEISQLFDMMYENDCQ